MSGMQIDSPAAGDYYVCFNAYASHTSTSAQMIYVIYIGDTAVTTSNRILVVGTTGSRNTIFTHDKVTVDGSQNIQIFFRTTAGTSTIFERSLIAVRVT
jgi:hypothetical protein